MHLLLRRVFGHGSSAGHVQVYVIVYGDVSSAEGTGVYSLWKCDGQHCSNTVIAFADYEDAELCVSWPWPCLAARTWPDVYASARCCHRATEWLDQVVY
jgi:hypothetical protein